MSTEFACPSCHVRLRVAADAAGKRVRCPRCGDIAPRDGLNRVTPVDKWSMKTGDGSVYGPVAKDELDRWVLEGRIDARCMVIREGTDRWQWASDVYPQLRPAVPGPVLDLPGSQPLNGRARAAVADRSDRAVPLATLAAGASNAPTSAAGRRRRRHFAPRRPRLRSTRSRSVAGMLGILLGAFGVHRMYLGYVAIGVVQLAVTFMTMGLGALWGVLEGALILGGGFNRDADGDLMD